MKHKLLKILVVGLAVCSLFSMPSMLTQDELGEVISRKNQLIKSGMSADEVNSLMDGITDWQEAVKVLDKKIAEVSSGTSSTPAAATTATPSPSATPTPTPKHEHKYSVKLTKDPTCYEEGTLTYTCDCGDTYEEPVAQLEHQYTDTVTKEPTCTTEGERTYKCSLCGDTYTEVIEAKGHMDGQFTITKEPTCTEPGEKTVYCKVCNEEIRTESIDPTGHENTGELITYGNFFSPDIDETRCLKCMAVLDTKEIPVPIWHYVVVGVPALIILIVIIAVLVDKIKHRKK